MYIGLVQTPGVFASVTGSQLTPQIVLWRMVLRLKLSKPELYLKGSEKHKKSPYSKTSTKAPCRGGAAMWAFDLGLSSNLIVYCHRTGWKLYQIWFRFAYGNRAVLQFVTFKINFNQRGVLESPLY